MNKWCPLTDRTSSDTPKIGVSYFKLGLKIVERSRGALEEMPNV